MVIDTSVLVAILLQEPDRHSFEDAIAESRVSRRSAVTYMEAGMVLTTRFGSQAEAALDRILAKARIVIHPLDAAQAKLALEAFRNYGTGRHPAGLNCGDCFSYALAKICGEPLLFKGDDFARTDVDLA